MTTTTNDAVTSAANVMTIVQQRAEWLRLAFTHPMPLIDYDKLSTLRKKLLDERTRSLTGFDGYQSWVTEHKARGIVFLRKTNHVWEIADKEARQAAFEALEAEWYSYPHTPPHPFDVDW